MLRVHLAKCLVLLKKKAQSTSKGTSYSEVMLSNTRYGLTPGLLNKGLVVLKYFVEDLTYAPVKEKTHQ